VPGKPVDPKTYEAEYQKELKTNGAPFYPDAFCRDLIAVSMALLAVVAMSAVLGPSGPGLPPDPALVHAEPRPDWYFLPIFALMALSPNWLETFLMLLLPPLIFLVLALVPFLAGRGERSPRRRPVAVLSVVVIAVSLLVLLWLGLKSPWSPAMAAWSGTPVPVNMVRRLTPEQLQGAATFQYKDCRNCHALEGTGGWRGPDLTTVATRLTHDELVRQVSQGGGLMPAYGQELSPREIEALVDFLGTLRPEGQPPATSPPKRENAP
jgi:ubiquinol-cytochrome c reductase cytochrome b subunit